MVKQIFRCKNMQNEASHTLNRFRSNRDFEILVMRRRSNFWVIDSKLWMSFPSYLFIIKTILTTNLYILTITMTSSRFK